MMGGEWLSMVERRLEWLKTSKHIARSISLQKLIFWILMHLFSLLGKLLDQVNDSASGHSALYAVMRLLAMECMKGASFLALILRSLFSLL